jgi:hypothetical protein
MNGILYAQVSKNMTYINEKKKSATFLQRERKDSPNNNYFLKSTCSLCYNFLLCLSAHDLAKGDKGGFNDPYIRVFLSPEVDTRKRETQIHTDESNPFFDEHYKFPVSQEDIKEKNLMLQVRKNKLLKYFYVVGMNLLCKLMMKSNHFKKVKAMN